MSKTWLIVNGDDFGSSEEVNEGVVRAHQEGVLTSCSLMVTGEAFDQAVRLAKENPALAVGIHLVTVMGRSVLPKSEIPNLVDEEGRFSNNPVAAGLKYYFSRAARREMRKELAAQFDKFKSSGLRLAHIDGHLHMHVHPVIFKTALELGEAFGVKRMRVPIDDPRLALEFEPRGAPVKLVHSLLFLALTSYMKRQLGPKGFVFTERVYGDLQSGRMSTGYFLHALENLNKRTNEIYFHPALFDSSQPLTNEQRQALVEFEALTSERVIKRVGELGIKLCSYLDLEPAR